MPSCTSHFAKSRWSEGPCPQMPTYLPALRQAWIARRSIALTAGSRSSNASATSPESRSRPSVSWVRSFEPIEKPSKCSRNCSARIAFEGSSHIRMSRSPLSPRFRPPSAAAARLVPALVIERRGQSWVLDRRLAMHADHVVDVELQAREAHSPVGQRLEIERELRIADVHGDLHGALPHLPVVPRSA